MHFSRASICPPASLSNHTWVAQWLSQRSIGPIRGTPAGRIARQAFDSGVSQVLVTPNDVTGTDTSCLCHCRHRTGLKKLLTISLGGVKSGQQKGGALRRTASITSIDTAPSHFSSPFCSYGFLYAKTIESNFAFEEWRNLTLTISTHYTPYMLNLWFLPKEEAMLKLERGTLDRFHQMILRWSQLSPLSCWLEFIHHLCLNGSICTWIREVDSGSWNRASYT